MNLAKYSLDNTKVIYFFLAVLLLGGIFSFSNLGKKEDAPFVIKSAVIMTRYPPNPLRWNGSLQNLSHARYKV